MVQRERDGESRKKEDHKEKSGVYVSMGNPDADLIMEVLLAKLVKVSKNQGNCLKDIKTYLSGLTQKIKSHATIIK